MGADLHQLLWSSQSTQPIFLSLNNHHKMALFAQQFCLYFVPANKKSPVFHFEPQTGRFWGWFRCGVRPISMRLLVPYRQTQSLNRANLVSNDIAKPLLKVCFSGQRMGIFLPQDRKLENFSRAWVMGRSCMDDYKRTLAWQILRLRYTIIL